MPYLIKLRTILQSKVFYIILSLFIICYVFITTILIKYETHTSSNIIDGTITSLSLSNDKISFILNSSEKVKCTYYIRETKLDNYNNLIGKKVRITGTTKNSYNNTIPNTFNYKKYLYNNKIYLTFNVNKIEIIENENIFYKIKNQIIKRNASYNDIVKTYLNLFILGDKNFLDENIYNTYKTNGIWHLFAISGMHISLIILVLDKLLNKIRFKKWIIIIILLYFIFLTGFSASVQRVTIFYLIKNVLDYLNINIDNKYILLIVLSIILIINPFMIYNVGFLYSFIITYSIMKESKYITGNYFLKIFKISLISFFVSLPITINMNYEINLLSILLNIFYVPFVSLIVFPISVITFILPFIYPILKILIIILEVTNNFFYKLKFSIIIPKMNVFIIITYYTLIYVYSKIRNKNFLLFSIIIIFINYLCYKLDNNYYIYYLNVSQGDSSLVITPYKREVIMIDTGGLINSDYHISDNTLLFLKSIGIDKIDELIITHGDFDHMGEAINLVNNFNIEKVIFNCGPYNDLEKELIKVLDKKKIKYYSCIKELNIDNNKLYFLQTSVYDNENDNSNVIYTELNGYKFMFMGDASSTTEKEILNKYDLPSIDVLKVGHHGSKTSSSTEFINEINPKYSIISVGKNNRYGHPNKEALDNLKNSKIYRTDQDGSIMFKIKNNKLKIDTCSP